MNLYVQPRSIVWSGKTLYEASLPPHRPQCIIWLERVDDYIIETRRGVHTMNIRFWQGVEGGNFKRKNPVLHDDQGLPTLIIKVPQQWPSRRGTQYYNLNCHRCIGFTFALPTIFAHWVWMRDELDVDHVNTDIPWQTRHFDNRLGYLRVRRSGPHRAESAALGRYMRRRLLWIEECNFRY